MSKDILATALSTLFCAYGKSDDTERQKVYYRALVNMDHHLILLACQKVLLNNVFLPSIAEIIENAKNIQYEIKPILKPKDWDEVVLEISRAVRSSPSDTFIWSTPEIEQAVRTYGLSNLRYGPTSSYSYALEIIRKNYLQICQRKNNSIQNSELLSIYNSKCNKFLESAQISENEKTYLKANELISAVKEYIEKEKEIK